MKKFPIFLLLLFLSACLNFPTYDKEFKNPIFYQPLEPLPKELGYVYITPTSIDIRDAKDKNITYKNGNCKLVENKENFIKLLCRIRWPKNEKMLEFSKYVLGTTTSSSQKETYEKYLLLFSGNYYENEYYTYTIQEPFLDNCIKIEQNIYKTTDKYIGKISSAHFCITPIKN
ncbi:MAG: hypothetical protein J6Y53_00645 [Alphaproteobacteria bacterium]|nr:hypothetical protein [Alphaproteobacteria bacterium]